MKEKNILENKTIKLDVIKSRFLYYGIILLLPVVLYGFLCPLEIYAGNSSEFLFATKDFIWMFFSIFGLIWFAGSIILCIMPQKISSIISTVIFSLGLLSYIQNMFLNGKLSKDDGSGMDWQLYRTDSYINLAVWLVLFIIICFIPFALKIYYKKIFMYISGFIALVQVVAVFSLLLTSKYDAGLDNKYEIISDKQYLVGNESNVIVFILDKYGNEKFDALLSEDEHFADCLKDFVYYKDMNSTYAYTTPAITYTFTGYENLEMSHYKEYRNLLDEAWSSDQSKERFNLIKEAGYERNLYTLDYGYIYVDAKCLEDVFDNMGHVKLKTDKGLLFRLFVKTSIYKCCPTILKPKFETMYYSYQGVVNYQDGKVCDYYNYDYYAGLINEGLSFDDNVSKKFIIEHLSGNHDACIDENGQRVHPTDETIEEDRKNNQRGMMLILEEYFTQLKALGVYDSSTIIIMSDHGDEYQDFDPQPVFFIKDSNQQFDAMVINEAPVSSEDILPTILKNMGINDYNRYGTSIYEWKEGDKRTRSCGYPENDYEPLVYTGNRQDLIEVMKNTSQKHELTQTYSDLFDD